MRCRNLCCCASTTRDRPVVLERHVGARPVGKEADRAWPRPDRDAPDHFVGLRVDRVHGAIAFARHVDDLAVGPDRDPFRLLADLHRGGDRARRGVDDAHLRGVLVRDVQPRAVRADRELLGVARRRGSPASPCRCRRPLRRCRPRSGRAAAACSRRCRAAPGGEPLSATYSDLPSGVTWMPRGRLPSGAVATTACVAASITVRSPDVSFVTKTRTAGSAGAERRWRRAAPGASTTGAWPQPAASTQTAAAVNAKKER